MLLKFKKPMATPKLNIPLKDSLETIDLRKSNKRLQDSIALDKELQRSYVGDQFGYFVALGRKIRSGSIVHIKEDKEISEALAIYERESNTPMEAF